MFGEGACGTDGLGRLTFGAGCACYERAGSGARPIGVRALPTSLSIDHAAIRLEEGKLVVRGSFGPEDEKRYSNALMKFLSMGLEEYVIDLSDLDRISRPYVDLTVSFARVASQGWPRVIVLASRMVARQFRLADFDAVGRTRVVRN